MVTTLNGINNIGDYFQTLALRFIDFLPQLIGAVIVLIIGWVVAVILASLVRRLVRFSGIDGYVERTGLNRRLNIREQSSWALVSNVVASIVKWVIVIGTVGIAANMLNLPGVQQFIGTILAYIPNVIVAIIILTIGVVAAQIVSELVMAGESLFGLTQRSRIILSRVARYAIIVFSVMAALTQLNIVPQLIEIAFAGMVLALALAFGLGGREHAREWIANLRQGT
jgi:hypothetical protein